MKKRIWIIVIAALAGILIALGARNIATSAKQNETAVRNSCYESYTVRENETLWSIAGKYAARNQMTTQEYVNELKRVNGLTSDKIIAGGNLVVVYEK